MDPVPVGAELEVVGAGTADRFSDRRPLCHGRLGVATAYLRPGGVDPDRPARLGVDERQRSDRRELELTWVDDLDREHLVAQGQHAQASLPVTVVEEVGDDHDETAPPDERGQSTQTAGQVDRAVLDPVARCQGVQQRLEVALAATRREHALAARFEQHRTQPVAGVVREEPDRGGSSQGQVGLLAIGGAEVDAGGAVDDDPALELAVGDGGSDVGLLHARSDVPVDAADVVARDVGAGLTELGAMSGDEAQVVTVEQAVESVRDGELEAAEHVVGTALAGWACRGRGSERVGGVRSPGHDACSPGSGSGDGGGTGVAGGTGEAGGIATVGGWACAGGAQGTGASHEVGCAGVSWCSGIVAGGATSVGRPSCAGAMRGAGTVERTFARIWSTVIALGQGLV